MERRFVLFLVLSFAILFGYGNLMRRLNPPKPQPPAEEARGEQPGAQDNGGKQPPQKEPEDDGPPPPKPPEDEPKAPPEPPEQEAPKRVARSWGTLGSADPDAPYRTLVTWDNKGASIARVELNSPRYRDLEDRSGYLGHLVLDEDAIEKDLRDKGCLVQVVGPGTPADQAGLKPGDLIVAVGNEKIGDAEDFREALKKTKPKRKVTLTVVRDKKEIKLEVTLERRPLEVIRREADDPASFLLTLQQVKGPGIEDQVLSRDDEGDDSSKYPLDVGKELPGLDLWTGNWEVAESDQTHVVFRRKLPKWNLEITKAYHLKKVPTGSIEDENFKAYHLELQFTIENTGQEPRVVAYQLDGPTGLPAEGAWYSYKIGRKWFQAVGLRDVVVSKVIEGKRTFDLIGCPEIAEDEFGAPAQDQSVSFIGVDAKYFASVLIPQGQGDDGRWASSPMKVAQWQPLRVGAVDEKEKKLTNTSCRLTSQVYPLAPGGTPGDALSQRFVIFAGPKKPDILAKYGLGELIYYGWFGALAEPMSGILHFFYRLVPNYGLAILMLTVLVRGCMFPLSRKQALGARKMQELQPEMKRLQERYKNDMEGRTKAQQELFRKHNYNPLSGCLVLFVQLPIFVALYRSLMVDIELRGAPLLWSGIRWCSNLSAPDMLYNWSGFMPEFISSGRGFLGLGPYFNILPIFTVVLFIVQQKMFMPPALDEKAAMQQKMMKYMMIFIGLMFFKVASGLCVYFIASSLWGLAERQFLPKPAKPDAKPATRAEAKARDKPRPKPAPQQAAPSRDGDAARKKKKKVKRGKK